MEVSSKKKEPDGQDLLEVLVSLTGLPKEWILKEMDQIMREIGKNPNEMTLDHLREALVSYLNSIHAEIGHTELG
jgi:hypothetical protein